MSDADILIAGGGSSALALAAAVDAAFAEQSAPPPDMLILEPQSPSTPESTPAGADVPSLALNRRTVALLRRWAVWPSPSPAHATPILGLKITERGGGRMSLAAADLGWENLGEVVEARWLMRSLREHLQSRARWLSPVKIIAARPTPRGFEVEVEGHRVSTSLLAAADGIDSPLREMLGVAFRETDCGKEALLVNAEVDMGDWTPGWAMQSYLSDGSLALLPLPSGEGEAARMLLVRTASTSHVEDLLALQPARRCAALNEELAAQGLRLLGLGEPRRRPLRLLRTAEQWRRALALIGDAAHAVHPGAAQGFNLTMRDVWALARCLARADREDLGSVAALGAWGARREREQDWVIGVSDGLPRLFELPGRRLRALGFAALGAATPLRSAFARRAAGF